MYKVYLKYIYISILIGLFGCQNLDRRIPIIGNIEIQNGDTLYHVIPDIELIDQDSQTFRVSQLEGKLILADFFFTSCPSICPKVTKQMLRLYDIYKHDNRVVFISHTIDQRHDSVSVLNRYAKNLGVDVDNWKFVTGNKDSIYYLAEQYFVSVQEDPSAPMGFDHSGRIIMVDMYGHVRGYAEGTDPQSISDFINVINQLLRDEY